MKKINFKKTGFLALGMLSISNVFAQDDPFAKVTTLAGQLKTAFNTIVVIVGGIAIVAGVLSIAFMDSNDSNRKMILKICGWVIIAALLGGALTYATTLFKV